MAENKIPDNTGQLIGLGTKMLAGLISLGETLGITQISPVTFEFALNDFTACEGAFSGFRSARQVASTAWQGAANAVEAWLLVTRSVLAGRFGNRWSPLWAQAGFINHTTAVPRRVEDRLSLALALAGFFGTHASYEVASMLVTGARATTLRNAALGAFQTLSAVEQNLETQGTACGSARETLVGLMRGLIKILGATIGRDDPRWLAFGLQMPGANTTPGQPVNVSAGLDYTGQISVQCEAVALATRYRWRTRLADVQPEYQLAASTTGPAALLDGLAPGTRLEIIVQAVNGGAQGVASVPILFTMPLSAAAREAAKAEPKAQEPKPTPRHGNGNGNGLLVRTV